MINMFHLKRAKIRYTPTEFNADHVRHYHLELPYVFSKEYHIKNRIEHFKVRNFFRYIFGKPLLSPKKYRTNNQASIVVTWTNGHSSYFYYSSVLRAEQDYNEFDSFMWGIGKQKNKS